MQGERSSAGREHSRGPPSFPWHKMSWNSTNISSTYLLTSNIYTVCTGFIRLDWECISHYFSWLQSQVYSEFAADWNLVNGCDWWGQNIAQNSTQSYIVSSALQHYLSPLLCSSQPITLLLSSQQITEYDQFCTMDAVQKSENETESSGKEMQNIKTGKSRRKTGEGRVDKQGVHEWTNRVCN